MSGSKKYVVNWANIVVRTLCWLFVWLILWSICMHLNAFKSLWPEQKVTKLWVHICYRNNSVCIVDLAVPPRHRINVILRFLPLILSQENRTFELGRFVSSLFVWSLLILQETFPQNTWSNAESIPDKTCSQESHKKSYHDWNNSRWTQESSHPDHGHSAFWNSPIQTFSGVLAVTNSFPWRQTY